MGASGGGGVRTRDTLARYGAVYLAVLLIAAASSAGAGAAPDPPSAAVSLVPAAVRGVGNCIPLANNTTFGFSGFIYRNVPAFSMRPGTPFAFDLGAPNDRDVRRNIYFATASANPAPGADDVRALGWAQVASDEQVPQTPRGDTVAGNYELRFRSEGSFDFPGGGLVVGFGASPPGAYADPGCEQVVVHTDQADPSGHFFARFWGKADRSLGVLTSGSWDTRWLGGIVIWSDEPPVTVATVDPAPDVDGWVVPPATVTLTATDDVGVAKVGYAIDGGSVVWSDGDTVSFVLDEPGEHDVRYGAVDTSGNVEAQRSLTVRVVRWMSIDAMPANPVNPWNARRSGPFAVSVAASPGVDPLVLEDVRFSGIAPRRCAADGADLLCQVDAGAVVDGAVVLTAWLDGTKVMGRDAMRVVGP